MSLDDDTLKRLADEVLTFIEQREAEQVAYGIYDVTMTGVEVIDNFQPSEDIPLAAEDKTEAVLQALQYLSNDLQIIRFDRHDSPSDWIFRSRIAETVRLIVKLRQRIVNQNNEKPAHRISKCKRLVSDVKFSVASRRVPRRNIVVDECLKPLLDGEIEQQQAAKILLEVINNSLPKLRSMSGFQNRTFEKILQVIELDKQQGIEKGVVVTASTGAGKTYAFFLPILAKMIIERCLRGKVGVKAICIYPRVALSENQLTDFIEVLFHLNQILKRRNLPTLTIGLESGAAVYQVGDFRDTRESRQKQLEKMRGWTFQDSGYLSPFAYCVGTSNQSCNNGKQRLIAYSTQPDTLVCPVCNKQYPFIQFARDVMEKHPPDLLISTTESLHRRLLSSKYQYLFGTEAFCAPSVVMLDEIHLQTSTAGTQVALLLRRLMARIHLGQKERNESANLAFVGLSATIAEPPQFLSELSGVPVTRISHVTPQEEEMQTIGAERYIFVRAEENEDTAIISTLIQTAMCVLHTMPQPAQGRYRTFGFVQSLDLVGRWRHQMQDAEKVKREQIQEREREKNKQVSERQIRLLPLYTYRFPPFNKQLFPNFLKTNFNCDCHGEKNQKPDLNCPLFQAGECWWVLSQNGKSRREPLKIKQKTGSDRAVIIEPDDDLVITTSALEVGYDDEDLMCVLQYQAPANVASFVQRKGRGGRKVGTRPIIITVLSPYKPTDLFLFRNEHLLTDPTFQKLPLNPQNRYLQRIHGFYAFFDWLAYRASRMGIGLDLDRLYRPGYQYLMEQTANSGVLLEFKDYLQKTFAIPDDAITRVLGSENEGLLWSIFHRGLMKTVHPGFEKENQSSVDARKLLDNHLPENLFSDINLPEVRVDYKPGNSDPNKKTNSESISLAISETIPGNVTFRGGEGSTWIPPEPSEDEITLITLSQYYRFKPNPINNPNTVNLPVRALKKVEIIPQSTLSIPLYRPTAINPTQFSRDHNSSFWWCNPETQQLNESRDPNNAAQDTYQLAHSTSAIPINAVDIQPIRRDNSTPAYTFTGSHDLLSCDPFSKILVQKIVFYSDEPENLNLLKVQRLILGSEYTIKFHQSAKDEIRGIVGFKAHEDEPTHCALGYELLTDGVSIDLNADRLQNLALSTFSQANLKTNIIRHAFITKLTVESEYRENYFASENLVNVLLTIADTWCGREKGTIEGLREWFTRGNARFEREFTEAINQIHQLSQKKQEAIRELASSENDYLSILLDIYTEVHGLHSLYQQYLRDSFQYSITQALKQVAQEVAGVEALNYVAAWTELKVDFDERASDRIYLYEIGMGGIGVMRATHDLLRKQPDRFWTTLAEKMTRCPTAKEESFLRYLLAQPEDWLEQCETWIGKITEARKSLDRQRAIDNLLFQLRRQLCVPVRQAQLKSLLRVFIPDYIQEVDGNPIVNWRIFREINHQFLPDCADELNRDPSFTEARAMLYRKIYRARQEQKTIPYAESYRLLQLYEQEYGTAGSDARKYFEGAVERRMLLNCRCSCSSCLDDRSSDIESPGLGRNLLNRPLLTEWLTQVRTRQTLEIAASEDAVSVCDRMRRLLENKYRVIYLRVNSENLSSLCTTISYLTDAGIDTDVGMVYPAISDIQTIYPNHLNATEPPIIEVTIRPIQ